MLKRHILAKEDSIRGVGVSYNEKTLGAVRPVLQDGTDRRFSVSEATSHVHPPNPYEQTGTYELIQS